MKNIAQYAVISDYPYRQRTEHVHIGLLVFRPDGEVRIHLGTDLRKVRAIYPRAKMEAIRAWESELPSRLKGATIENAHAILSLCGSDWRLSETTGRLAYDTEDNYLHRVRMALMNLVDPVAPAKEAREATSRLFTDLKQTFRSKGWLGKNIDAHEIVPRFSLGPEVTAEFALKNGRLHVIETLDLRTSNPSTKRTEAHSKALVFDMARRVDPCVARYAVMAGFSSRIALGVRDLLSSYSDRVYSWESVSDMSSLLHTLEEATGRPALLPPPI